MTKLRFLGLDVHAERIAVAVAEPGGRSSNLNLSDEVKEIAWKAQYRLHKRYTRLTAGGKNKNQTVAAAGRELLGFIWDIPVRTERAWEQTKAA